MLKVAILYQDNSVYIEWTPEKFAEVLKGYVEKYGVDEALVMIERDIKKETRIN